MAMIYDISIYFIKFKFILFNVDIKQTQGQDNGQ